MKKMTIIITQEGYFQTGSGLLKQAGKLSISSTSLHNIGINLTMSGKPWICPDTALQNYPETRLGYVVTTLQSLMTNHFPLSVSLHAGSNGDFGKVWKKLSKTDIRNSSIRTER